MRGRMQTSSKTSGGAEPCHGTQIGLTGLCCGLDAINPLHRLRAPWPKEEEDLLWLQT